MVNMKMGERLKRLRKECGYSQEMVAKYLGVDQTMLSRMENEERNITLGVLIKLAECYRCELKVLMDENIEPEVIKIPFRSQEATASDFCQISKANKIILNLREMLSLKES